MAKCKNCGEGDKIWTQNDEGKWRLLNADSSPHRCMSSSAGTSGSFGNFTKGSQQQQQPQQQQQVAYATEAPIPRAQQQQQHPTPEEWNALWDKVSKISEMLTTQGQFYEGIVQFLQQARLTDAKIERILALTQSTKGKSNQRDELSRPAYRATIDEMEQDLQRQEEEYDRDKEDGTLGLA